MCSAKQQERMTISGKQKRKKKKREGEKSEYGPPTKAVSIIVIEEGSTHQCPSHLNMARLSYVEPAKTE